MSAAVHHQSFITHLKDVKRFSPHTLVAYQNDLDQYALYLHEQFDLDIHHATHHLVRSWVVALMEQGVAAASINRKLSALRTYYAYTKSKGQVSTNPVSKISSLKSPKRLPITARWQDVERLLDLLKEGDTFEEIRNYTMILLLVTCGLRRSELLSLSMVDIDLSRASIKVMGKGAKERAAPLLPIAMEAITDYLAYRRSIETDHDAVFVDDRGDLVTDRKLYSIVKASFSLVTTQGNISPHKLRHTFATHLLNQGADLLAVKELLGHASLAATQVYTHNDIGALQRAYRGAHPRS